MNIGIDAQYFGPQDRGLGRYTQELVNNLRNIDDKNQYFIFPRKMSFLKRQLFLFSELNKHKLDLMHFTYFNVPILYRRKFIMTIHDLNFSYANFFKKIIYRLVLKSAIRRAKRIIAVSEYTKQDILRHYKLNPDKIKVIYEGIT